MHIVRIGGVATEPHSADEVGAKAANLARMAALGLPVPPAFVLPVRLCADIIDKDAHAESDLRDGLKEGIAFLESATGKRFGDHRQPLLVSVRSGAARSMPGMLDTVLNVGCTSAAVQGLIRLTGRPRLAWDCRRRFLESYTETVLGLDPGTVRCAPRRIDDKREASASDRELDSEALERLAADERALIEERDDDGWLEDAPAQLESAARAVYRSWMSERAQSYRRLQKLDHLEGTAVTVQAMVFGNGGLSSGAGVAFSRDPSTGLPQPMIDLVLDAQGEDVVSGRRTPDTEETIVRSLPKIAAELGDILKRLEQEFGDVQDVEFTIEDGKLWILQTRSAKRTPRAGLRIAIDLVHEGLITQQDALERIAGIDLAALVQVSLVAADAPVLSRNRRVRRHRGRTRGVLVRKRRAACGRGRPGDPDASRYQHRRCRGLCGRGRHRDVGGRPHRPCRAGRAPDGKALHRRMQRHDDRRGRRPGAACRHHDLGKRLDHHRRRQRQHLSRTARDRRDAARGGARRNRELAIAGA